MCMAYPTLSILSEDDVVYCLSKNTCTGSMEALMDVDARARFCNEWECFYTGRYFMCHFRANGVSKYLMTAIGI
jgi:hypothetical protein